MARWERYDLLMYFSIGTQRKDKMVFLDGRADGVIFPEESSVNISSYLAQKGLPVVVIYKRNVAPGVACAKADDFQAACLAVRHLWEHGHHRIAHLAGHLADWSDAQERLAGYRSAMNELGVTETPEEWVFNRHSWDSEKCGEALDLWLALPPDIRPSAIFSANDAGALGLIEEAGKRGLKIPEDLSIVGCDNIETSESKLTTIDLNFHEVGRYSVESLINIIEGIKTPEECRTPIQVKLIRRNTVRQYNQKKEG